MARFNLDDYETVESRLEKFWAENPEGRIWTDLVSNDGKTVIIVAHAYRRADDTHPAATGFAEETKGSSNVNQTSHVENCETSAIGRALANMGYATKGKRPSREEVSKVLYAEKSEQFAMPKTDVNAAKAKVLELAGDKDNAKQVWAQMPGTDEEKAARVFMAQSLDGLK